MESGTGISELPPGNTESTESLTIEEMGLLLDVQYSVVARVPVE